MVCRNRRVSSDHRWRGAHGLCDMNFMVLRAIRHNRRRGLENNEMIEIKWNGIAMNFKTSPNLFSPNSPDAGTNAMMLSCVSFSPADKVLISAAARASSVFMRPY